MKAVTNWRVGKILLVTTLVLALVMAVFAAAAPVASAASPPGPQNQALGKSLGEWFEMWAKYSSPYGGGPDHHGNIRFMPLPAGDCSQESDEDPVYCVGELDVALKHKQGFFLPVNGYTGWLYSDDSEDPLLDDSTFLDADVDVTLDDALYFGDEEFDLADFYAEQYFDPILYVDEEEEGYVADIFVQGVAFICPELSRGTHELHLVEHLPAWNIIWDNTWHITVK